MAKDRDYNRLIHTARWLRLRRDTLTWHPLCQRCEAEGVLTPSAEVHHVRPAQPTGAVPRLPREDAHGGGQVRQASERFFGGE